MSYRRGEATPRPRSAVSRHSGTGEAWPRPYERNDIACGPTRSPPKRSERLRWVPGTSILDTRNTVITRRGEATPRPRSAVSRHSGTGEAWPRPYGPNDIACGPTRSPPKRSERLRWVPGTSILDTRNTVITRRGEATPRPRSAVSRHSGTGEAWPRPTVRTISHVDQPVHLRSDPNVPQGNTSPRRRRHAPPGNSCCPCRSRR